MKKTIYLLSFAFIVFSCTNVQNESETTTPEPVKEHVRDGIFIHISHGPENPHRVLMALKMADVMSETKDVLIYFDIEAVHVVLKDAPTLTMEDYFPPSHKQLKKLIDKNLTLMVCPSCLKAAGKTPEDVMDGVEIADKETFFSFTKGKILSIDY